MNMDHPSFGHTVVRYSAVPLILWSLLVGASLWLALDRLQHSTHEIATAQGEKVFNIVVALRDWNAQHGGIYVYSSEQDPPNPYLDPSIRENRTAEGRPLTLLNPAYMTRQLSGVIERKSGLHLHLTSLKPLNPGNVPNDWQRSALQSFEHGKVKYMFTIDEATGFGRYMAPLYVEKPCLSCHAQQGYKLGDVRGGLAVEWSVASLLDTMHATREHLYMVHGTVWVLVSLLILGGIRQITRNLSELDRARFALVETNKGLEETVAKRTRQLEDSMQTLRSVGDLAPGVLYQFRRYADGKSCIPYASENFKEMFGLSPEAVKEDASTVFRCVHPQDLDGLVSSTELSAKELSRWHHQFRIIRPDGSIRWIEGDTLPVKEETGGILWNGFLTDITEKKAQEAALAQSQEAYRQLFENIQHGVVFQDAQGRIVAANPKAESILGWRRDQLIGRSAVDPVWQSIREDGSPFPGEQLPSMEALRTGRPVRDVVMGVFNPQMGAVRWLLVTTIPKFQSDVTSPFEVFTTFTDITERRKAELVLRRHKTIIETARDGFWVADAQGWIQEVNQAYADMTGYTIEELLHMHISDLEARERAEEVREHMAKIVREGHDQFESLHRHKDGHAVEIELSITYMADTQQFCVFCRDIRDRKRMEAAMRDLAYFDALTGLPNRRMLSDRLKMAMASTQRDGNLAALMFLDLDNFKPLNDQYGHEVGDLLLQEVARRLQALIRGVDTVARFGGDEFVILLSQLEGAREIVEENAKQVAEKVRIAIDAPYHMEYKDDSGEARRITHRCSVSVGVVLFSGHDYSEHQLIGFADQAMYAAKQAGRDCIRISVNGGQ